MKKMYFLLVILMLMTVAVLSSRDVIGHISTDVVLAEYGEMSHPLMTTRMPKLNTPALLIKYPGEVMEFFKREGISRDEMTGLFVSEELAKKICSICEGQNTEFCNIMRNIVARFSNPQYETYVVQLGTLYWTVYT